MLWDSVPVLAHGTMLWAYSAAVITMLLPTRGHCQYWTLGSVEGGSLPTPLLLAAAKGPEGLLSSTRPLPSPRVRKETLSTPVPSPSCYS